MRLAHGLSDVAASLPGLVRLLAAPTGSSLGRLVRSRPGILKAPFAGYVAANWDPQTRIVRIIEHCQVEEAIGGAVDVSAETVVDLARLQDVDVHYRMTLDRPHWLLREGAMTMSLWDGIDRIFSLSFSLSSHFGRRIVYVGGLQGRRSSDALERYKRFTKFSFGIRPRDFLIEVFKKFCRSVDVTEIRGVATENHYLKKWISSPDGSSFHLSYNEIWRERGGIDQGDGFFLVPVGAIRRTRAEIDAKKRAMYHKRYKLLDSVREQIKVSLERRQRGESLSERAAGFADINP